MSPKKILETRIPLKQLAPPLILIVNSMVWFAIITTILAPKVDTQSVGMPLDTFVINGCYFVGIALSALIGAILVPSQKENRLLLWMIAGVLTTMSIITFQNNQISVNMFFSVLLGASIGMGLPSSLAYFADTTGVDNRGTYGGLIWLPLGLGVLMLGFITNSLDTSLALSILAVWRLAGAILFFVASKIRGQRTLQGKKTSYEKVVFRRDLILYLVPWLMFSLVNFSESPIVTNVSRSVLQGLQPLVGSIEFAISGVFAVIGGILSDRVGRKRTVITGFILVGIEYAILSLFSGIEASWYIYMFCDGIAWGLFASVFFMTIWGDLAETNRKEKYYVVGGLPYLLAGFMSIVIQAIGWNDPDKIVTAFSLASFFLFVAVLPLMYAPETLPEKRIRDRELRDYLEKAKKTRDKYT